MAQRRLPCRPWSRRFASASFFCPCSFLQGVSRYLFAPLAEAVMFAMIASYILSRTLVPTLAMYLLRPKEHSPTRAIRWWFSNAALKLASSACAGATRYCLPGWSLRARFLCLCFLRVAFAGFSCCRFSDRISSPARTRGEFILHIRAQDRNSHRRNGAAGRPGGSIDPPQNSGPGTQQHPRQPGPALQPV